MNILLRSGEYLWGPRGSHVCDEKGFVIVLAEDTEVVIDDDVAESALAVIKADREFRGVDPETGLPKPEPEPEPIPDVVVEPNPSEEQPQVTEEVPNAQ